MQVKKVYMAAALMTCSVHSFQCNYIIKQKPLCDSVILTSGALSEAKGMYIND